MQREKNSFIPSNGKFVNYSAVSVCSLICYHLTRQDLVPWGIFLYKIANAIGIVQMGSLSLKRLHGEESDYDNISVEGLLITNTILLQISFSVYKKGHKIFLT